MTPDLTILLMTGTLVYFVFGFLVRIKHKFLPVSNKEKCGWLSEGTSAHTAACMLHCVFVSRLSGGFKAGAVLCLVLHRDWQENHPECPAEPEDGGQRLLHLSSVFVTWTKMRARHLSAFFLRAVVLMQDSLNCSPADAAEFPGVHVASPLPAEDGELLSRCAFHGVVLFVQAVSSPAVVSSAILIIVASSSMNKNTKNIHRNAASLDKWTWTSDMVRCWLHWQIWTKIQLQLAIELTSCNTDVWDAKLLFCQAIWNCYLDLNHIIKKKESKEMGVKDALFAH